MEKCEFLESFVFCPKCGGEFVDNNIKSKRCQRCGFTLYFNPSAAVVAIIKNNRDEILVATRAKEPAKGSYDLPGGFVDSFETGEMSVCREVMEECNLEVASTSYLFSIPNIYNYSNFDVHTLDLFFECRVDDFTPLEAADDVASLQFIPIKDLKLEKFGLRSIREGAKRYIADCISLG
ncbi:MAG: NUDIX domain-containing protein [Rikenellaceae bacterium]